MSVIAARIDENEISLASDSIITKDDTKRTNYTKLRQINNMIVGGCGTAEELSMFFMFVEENPLKTATTKSVLNYLQAFSDFKGDYSSERDLSNAYLIAYDGHLFECDGMFVREIFDYTAIGSGESFALAALYLGQNVQQAVDVACALCCTVAEPIVRYTMVK